MDDHALDPAALERFFTDYAAAFDSFEPERMAAFFHCPCVMVNADSVAVLPTAHAIHSNMVGLAAAHRAAGYGSASVREQRFEPLAPTLCLARVHWHVADQAGGELWDFWNTYNLVDRGEGWRILVSTTHAPGSEPPPPEAPGEPSGS